MNCFISLVVCACIIILNCFVNYSWNHHTYAVIMIRQCLTNCNLNISVRHPVQSQQTWQGNITCGKERGFMHLLSCQTHIMYLIDISEKSSPSISRKKIGQSQPHLMVQRTTERKPTSFQKWIKCVYISGVKISALMREIHFFRLTR